MADESDGQDGGAEASGAGVDPAVVALAFNHTTKITMAMRKMVALLFLIAIALIPFLIVAMYSREGGIWVLGYVTGIITVPVVGFAAIRAMSTLSDEGSFIGTVVFGFLVILISLATGFWASSR
jgi:heme/copper-type cytochrome/quinol oxidase subunit 4